MKKKTGIFLLLIIIMIVKLLNIKTYAATLPELSITSNKYSAGDKMNLDEINEVDVGKTLQLYAIVGHGNDVFILDEPDSIGWFVDEANLSNITWSSSDLNIATINNTGKVTGVSEGKAIITAKYNGSEEYRDATYEITVKPSSENSEAGIFFINKYSVPGKVNILGKNFSYIIQLSNIPESEKKNIKVKIEDESIAKLEEIDLLDNGEEKVDDWICVHGKLLALGNTTITATLNYNGKTYSDSYNISVVKSAYTLTIRTEDNKDIPAKLEAGEKIQLRAFLELGSTVPEDITSKGVIWRSSDEKIFKISDNGLATAVRAGTVILTAEYKIGDEIINTTQNIIVTDSSLADNKTAKEDPTTADKDIPKAGENIIVL